MSSETKTCRKCSAEKAIENFRRDSSYREGRRTECNVCRNARERTYGPSIRYEPPVYSIPSVNLSSHHEKLHSHQFIAVEEFQGKRIGPPIEDPWPQTDFPKYSQTVPEKDLPPPESLPAAYLKRCSDYWLALLGDEQPTTRIV